MDVLARAPTVASQLPGLTKCHVLTSSGQAWRGLGTPSAFTTNPLSRGGHLALRTTPGPVVCKVNANPIATGTAADVSQKVANSALPSDLAARWREIQGENSWQGLLDPLDRTLREEILRYGEFTQATYDAFDFDDHSKYCGSARYNKAKMLEKVGLPNTGYEVTKYFYATANIKLPFFFKRPESTDGWSKDSNWMGYVAVCTDEEKIKKLGRRDIVISWRGTIRNSEWAANFQKGLAPAAMDTRPHADSQGLGKIRVESGFLALYTSKNEKTRFNKSSARTQVLTELKRLIDLYKGEELSITVTGHSLGSALATLNAYDIAQSGLNHPEHNNVIPVEWNQPTAAPLHPETDGVIPITVYSFAGPRVGNDAFRDKVAELGIKVLRIVNVNDFVPRVPGLFLNESATFIEKLVDQFPFTYIHVGVELRLNNEDSQYLDKDRASKPNCHNLEQYLHLVDGHQGTGLPFKLTTGRQIALVNKSCNFLKKQQFIPELWWQAENKGLVMNENGEWVQPERDPEDIPTASNDFS